jgi:tetratricopeptide (TPR) repeat protein
MHLPRSASVVQKLALISLLATSLPLHSAQEEDLKAADRLYHLGETGPALTRVDAALTANPGDAQARFLKGVILTAQGRHEDAIGVFAALVQEYPELPEPRNNLAVLYAAKGQYEQARNELELAIRTAPDYAVAHENLGDIYARLAGEEYRRAAALDRNNITAAPKLKLVEQMLQRRADKSAVSAPIPNVPESR